MSIDWSSDSPIPADALAELLGHIDDPGATFAETRVRRHPLGCDVLTEVSWRELDSDGPGHTVRHTIAFLHRPLTTLPEFEVRPRKGMGEKVLGMLVSALGVPRMELADEPAFNDRYSVLTANAESVRVLLGRDAIDSILAVDDLFLKFSGRGVLVSRRDLGSSSGVRSNWKPDSVRDHRLDPDEAASLLEDATIAGGAIVDDPEIGRRAADAVEGSYAEEALESLQDHGGLIGRQIAKVTITGEMLAHIRNAPTPRVDVPGPIARRAWGGTRFPLLLAPAFGLAFLTMGIIGLVGGSTEGLVFVGVGTAAAIATAFILRHRMIRKRLVTRGIVAEGRVTSVERTDTSVNDDVQHRITVETTDGLEPVVITMGSAPARQARRLQEIERPTWVLRDPRKPSRGLWLEGWSLETALD